MAPFILIVNKDLFDQRKSPSSPHWARAEIVRERRVQSPSRTKLGTEPLLDLGSEWFLLTLLLCRGAAAVGAVHGAAWVRATIRGGAMPDMWVQHHDAPRFAHQQYLL